MLGKSHFVFRLFLALVTLSTLRFLTPSFERWSGHLVGAASFYCSTWRGAEIQISGVSDQLWIGTLYTAPPARKTQRIQGYCLQCYNGREAAKPTSNLPCPIPAPAKQDF